MFCKKCGFENKEQNLICNNCGHKLKNSNFYLFIIVITCTIVVLFVGIFPIVTNYLTDNEIDERAKQLKELGIDLSVVRSSGYFISTKEIKVKINNGRYFVTNILDKISKSNGTNVSILIDTVKDKNSDWESFFNGTTFDGKLIVHNYFLENPKLEISLEKLSHDVMFELQKNKETSKIILPLLDKKTISASINFSKSGFFESIKLKDIDETIIENNDRFVLQLLDVYYQNDNFDVGRVYMSIKNDGKVFVFQLDDIKSLINMKNNLKVSINNISFISDEFKFSAKEFSSGHELRNNKKRINFSEGISLKNIKVNFEELPISIDKVIYNLNVDDMAKMQFNQLIEDYKNKSANVDNYGEYEIGNIFKFINQGLSLKIDASVENLKIKDIHSGNYSFQTNLKIKENDLDLKNINLQKALDTIESIDVNKNTFVKLEIDEESAKMIMEDSDGFTNIFNKLGYLKDNKYSFSLWKKDENIVLNNLNTGFVSSVIADNNFNNKKYTSAVGFYKYATENGDYFSHFRLAYSYNEIKKYDLAINHYNEYINYENSVKDEKSKKNIPLAINNIANIYVWGKKDYKNALKWFLKSIASDHEDPDYFQIAYCYDMLKDYNNAKKWYLKAIKKNNEKTAMWNLGVIYEYGRGKVKKDTKKAFNLYLKAAELGYKNAIKRVAYFYRYGYGTSVNYEKANYWDKKTK